VPPEHLLAKIGRWRQVVEHGEHVAFVQVTHRPGLDLGNLGLADVSQPTEVGAAQIARLAEVSEH